jgi:class 3 adenylate cyclase
MLDVDDIRRVRRGDRIEREMSVVLADIRGYTTLVEAMSLTEAGDATLDFLRAVEAPIVANGGFLQDIRGDEILAVFDSGPDDAVRAALAMQRSLRAYNETREAKGAPALRAGIGINIGPVGLCLVGGVNRLALTIIGDAVNLASRIESANKRYGSTLLVSEHVVHRLGQPDLFCIRRMERVLVVNRRRPVTIYEIFDEDPQPLRAAKRSSLPAFDEAFSLFDAGDVEAARLAFTRCGDALPGDPVAQLHLDHCAAIAQGELEAGREVALTQK